MCSKFHLFYSPKLIYMSSELTEAQRSFIAYTPSGINLILCVYSAFKVSRKYLTFPLSQEEKDFPLAYSMVVHHKVYAYFSLNILTRCICSLKNQTGWCFSKKYSWVKRCIKLKCSGCSECSELAPPLDSVFYIYLKYLLILTSLNFLMKN